MVTKRGGVLDRTIGDVLQRFAEDIKAGFDQGSDLTWQLVVSCLLDAIVQESPTPEPTPDPTPEPPEPEPPPEPPQPDPGRPAPHRQPPPGRRAGQEGGGR